MSVEAVIGRAVPSVLDYDVSSVVLITRHRIRVHDLSVCDGAHFIELFALGVALQRPNVDAFMKARVNNSSGGLDRIAHETVLAAFPRGRFHAVINALDVLVKGRAVAAKERGGIGGEGQNEHTRVAPPPM